jgi:RNA polymerase sigma-70 factor (ECF subfamily)
MKVLDTQYFNELFQNCYQALCHYALKYVRDRAVAEDLVQDVFVGLWSSRDGIAIKKEPKNYLFTSVRNACIAHIKKMEKDQKIREQLHAQMSSSVSIREEMESIQLKLRLRKAIDHLPLKTREVFLLHKKEGLSFEEIASHLGKSVKTVEKQVARAYQLLKEELQSRATT